MAHPTTSNTSFFKNNSCPFVSIRGSFFLPAIHQLHQFLIPRNLSGAFLLNYSKFSNSCRRLSSTMSIDFNSAFSGSLMESVLSLHSQWHGGASILGAFSSFLPRRLISGSWPRSTGPDAVETVVRCPITRRLLIQLQGEYTLIMGT